MPIGNVLPVSESQAREMANKAAEIRLRAERRMGEMLKQQREAGLMNKGAQGNPGGQGASIVRSQGDTAQPTLSDVGISKSMSSRALPMLEAEAKKRRLATLKQNATVSQKIDTRNEGRATDKAAELCNTNRQYISDVKKIHAELIWSMPGTQADIAKAIGWSTKMGSGL